MSITITTKAIEWFSNELNLIVKDSASFNISSLVRIFNSQDAFNQEFFKDQKIIYPFLSYQLKAIEVDIPRMGSVQSRKRGQPLFDIANVSSKASITYTTDATKTRIKEKEVIPVTLEVDFTFITNTAEHIDEFITIWAQLYPQVGGYFTHSDVEFPINVIASTRMEFPEKEIDDKGIIYRLPLSCIIWTHVGSVTDIAAVQKSTAPIELKESGLTDKKGNIVSPAVKISASIK